MPKSVLNPQDYSGGLVPPVPEQSILLDRTRGTALSGFSPSDSLSSDLWTQSFWFKQTGDIVGTRRFSTAWIDVNNYTFFGINNLGNFVFEARIAGALQANFQSQRRAGDGSAWMHVMLVFDRVGGNLDLYVNGELWTEWASGPSIANVAGYKWLDSAADHVIGADGVLAQGFSGYMAEFHCTGGSAQLVTAFGAFNSVGVWDRIAYVGAYGTQGFYLTFGRTVDLGEDFSGNNNDFPTHTNSLSTDQTDDWMERNYCVVDINNPGTIPTPTEGGLVVGGGSNGRVTMQPAADTGVWYYEKDGVGVTWDTGVSGRFNPLLFAGAYNFGQHPFVGVGPGVGELTLCAPNLPASDVAISRDYFSAIGYEGDGSNPRTITVGDLGASEYKEILHRVDLMWAKRMENNMNNYAAHRLRPPTAMLLTSSSSAEITNDTNGNIIDLPAAGFEVDAGGTNNNNFNQNAILNQATAWRVSRYAQNIPIIDDFDDAEEDIASGDTDATSSDLELNSEAGGSGSEQLVGMRFLGVLIPNGATINGANVQFQVDETDSGTCDLRIWMEDADDPPAFIEGLGNDNITNRTKTSAFIEWNPPNWTSTGDRGADQRSPDISTAVKEVVDRGGWAPGQAMVNLIGHRPGSSEYESRTAEAHDDGDPPPMLQVAWDDGGIDTGMSLFTYTGMGNSGDTIRHGLGAVPDFFAIKNASAGDSWRAYHGGILTGLPAPEDGYLGFNLDSAAVDSVVVWNDTPPDADFITLGSSGSTNGFEEEYVGWAMREVEGFSKVFRYLGNGASNGPLIYCGFKPRLVVIKATTIAGNWFWMHRAMEGAAGPPVNSIHNQTSGNMYLNQVAPAVNDDNLLALANGFKILETNAVFNQNGAEYVGFAFAESPFQNAKAAT